MIRKYPFGFRRHSLSHYAASTWLRLGTPIHEVAEYLGDDPRTVLKIYAHILGEGQRRDFVRRLAAAEAAQAPTPPADDRAVSPQEIQAQPQQGNRDIGL